MKSLSITFDQHEINAVASDFDLRQPNKEALRQLIFALTADDFDPAVMQVMHIATGVGKTYLMAAFIEYLRRQGVNNVLIVTPSLTVQSKTIKNFTAGEKQYIAGSPIPPEVTTPRDYSAWRTSQTLQQINFSEENRPAMLFIFNIQQLIAPTKSNTGTHKATDNAVRWRTRTFDETSGSLFEYLQGLDDLVLIADESHLYSASAQAFSTALKELEPAATIGLTASATPNDHVIYKYPLYQAIADRYVKTPVLAFRKGGYGEDTASEELQLKDAMALREIKQRAYDVYSASHPEVKPINAVLFVVCADVAHATEVTSLLRSPEYFGKELAVLQVDNEHDDEMTRRMLDRLDEPDSTVKVVVSVNKLKEGWDVKSIAVIVTLRAMASEVLTQQTMGRGLRLPFGKYTNVFQIDQLDIIAHQSFKDLLAAENILSQFGLDEAMKSGDEKVRSAIQRIGTGTHMANTKDESDKSDSIPSDGHSIEHDDRDNTSNELVKPEIGIQLITENLENNSQNEMQILDPVWVSINEKFKNVRFAFPRTIMRAETPPFSLADISQDDLKQAASRVTSSGEYLLRKEIVVSISKKLHVTDTESAEVESLIVSKEEAALTLLKMVTSLQKVPATKENIILAERYIIPKFMESVTLKNWTVKAVTSATMEIEGVIKERISDLLRQTKEITTIEPILLPINTKFMLPIGTSSYDQIEEARNFQRGRYYSGWFKSLFEIESFDSWSGEYQLAKLLNVSPNIVWWKRLHISDGAFIQYNLKQKYYPDFVAFDSDGTYWIIEGKSVRGREDSSVQEKKKAAEKVVIQLLADPNFSDQRWGYLIGYEDDVKKADTWEELKTLANPIEF